MKKNLSNVIPNSSERLLLLEVEMMEFSKGRYFYRSHLKLKRRFFWTFLKGVPFYNVPFMVRNYNKDGERDYIFSGTYSNRVYPIVSLYKYMINFQSDTHPILRYKKTNDSTKFLSNELQKMSLHEASREVMNRNNNTWNVLAAGYALDFFFGLINEDAGTDNNVNAEPSETSQSESD